MKPQPFVAVKNFSTDTANAAALRWLSMKNLPPLIQGLLKPRAYPPDVFSDDVQGIGFSQTHISYLFFTPRYVYKIKKPVNFGFLDFTTLKKRLYFCKEEVRLNRRLSPDVYIGVVPVTKEKNFYRMEGSVGRAVEYAVKMKRLPAEAMLDKMMRDETVTLETVKKIARLIADFHRGAATGQGITRFGSPLAIKRNTDENFRQTRPFIGITLDKARYREIKEYTEGFIKTHQRFFKKRMRQGFIKDCHGDMHSEHISISDGISIFDSIEFNRRFRYSDVISDMAFLSMDMDYRSRGDLSRIFDHAYFSRSGDRDGAKLLNFYKCYRAYVRGKVEGFRFKEPEETPEDKHAALLNAQLYFRLAELYAKGGFKPTMVIVCGLTGAGKTAVAGAVKEFTGMSVLSSDRLRKELFGIAPQKRVRVGFGKGIYSEEATEKTYSALMERASEFLSQGRSVILDATFSKGKYIKAAEDTARKNSALFYIIECALDEKTLKKRLERRRKEAGAISDATFRIYKKQKVLFEKIKTPSIRVSTDKPIEEIVEEVVKTICEMPR